MQPHLPQAEQVEVIDQEGREEQDDPAEREQNAADTDDRAAFGEALASALTLAHRIDEALAQDAYLEEFAARNL